MTSSEIWSSDIMFNIACELSQPMGKTEFSSTAKKEQTLSNRYEKYCTIDNSGRKVQS